MEIRHCGGCNQDLHVAAFSPSKLEACGYASQCRRCKRAAADAWAIANPERLRASKRRERINNAERIRETNKAYYQNRKTPEQKAIANAKSLEWMRGLRRAAIIHLGGECISCRNSDPRVLQIDHVLGDGAEERRNLAVSTMLRQVIDTLPGERYQLLCANCNWIKRTENDESR